MTPRPGLAGVVLCGGLGTRMGEDKALLEVGGRALVDLVAERVAEAADPVFLAPGESGRLGPRGYPELPDVRPSSGPLGGLIPALEASPHPLVAAVAVDMPFASPEVLRLLAGLHAGEDAVLPVTSRGPEPLHAVYARSAEPSLREALSAGRLALRDALSRLRVREVAEPEWREADPTGRFARNLNHPSDLRALRRGA